LLTAKTGKNIASGISGKTGTTESIKNGMMNVVSPELGIMRGEAAHMVKGFDGASKGERAAALSLMNGNFEKVLKSKTFSKSEKLQSLAKDMQIGPAQAVLKANPNASLKGHEELFKNHPIGQLVGGMTEPLKKINPKNVQATNKIQDISEGVGNLGVGIADPGVALLNMGKRYGALDHNGTSRMARGMHSAKNWLGKTFVTNPAKALTEQGAQNIVRSNRNKNVIDYVMNPVTGGMRDLGNKMGLQTNKLLKQNGVSQSDIVNGSNTIKTGIKDGTFKGIHNSISGQSKIVA